MRAAAAFTLVAALLIVSGCASHRAVVTATIASLPERHLVLISADSGAVQPGFPSPSLGQAVSGAVSDGHGGWFVAGGLGLARLRPDGRLDPNWRARPSVDFVACLLIRSGSRLYVEGSERVEAFDAKTGARLWVGPRIVRTQAGICNATVQAIAASAARVYVGGNFTRIGRVARRSLAALDARTGRLLAWRSPPLRNGDASTHYVTALALAGSRLYVGGVFSSVGGQPCVSLAALEPRTGALLSWKRVNGGDANGDVDTILVTHGQVITAGYDGFGATDTHTGRPLAWTTRLGGVASAFAVDGPLVYLGGDLRNRLQSVAGHPRNNLAALSLATGHFTTWGPNLAPYVSVGAIVPSGNKVLVLGTFTTTVG
jgi:hypothetical protein